MSTQAPRPQAALSAKGMRFALCATRWNLEIVEHLLLGARAALEERGAEEIRVLRCAGVFELGPLAARVARAGEVDGIVALGCLIRGATDHYSVLAAEVSRALGMLATAKSWDFVLRDKVIGGLQNAVIDADPRVKLCAGMALAQFGDPKAKEVLKKFVES